MATWIGVGIGLTYIVVGWAMYVYAPKIGPNPVFGVRTWYSMVSKDVWNLSNRAGGILCAVVGALVALSSVLTRLWIDANSDVGVLTIVGIDLALTAVAVVWIVLYTRRLVSGVQIQDLGFLWVSPWWLLPATLLTLGVLAFLLATSSGLPVDRVATHFDAHGDPNDWMSRAGHTWFGSAIVLGMFALLSALFLILTHVPIPRATTWPIAGEPVMHFLAGMLFFVEAVMGAVFLDVYWFNTRGEHIVSMGRFTLLVIGVIMIATVVGITYIVVYDRRLRRRRTYL